MVTSPSSAGDSTSRGPDVALALSTGPRASLSDLNARVAAARLAPGAAVLVLSSGRDWQGWGCRGRGENAEWCSSLVKCCGISQFMHMPVAVRGGSYGNSTCVVPFRKTPLAIPTPKAPPASLFQGFYPGA